MSISEKLNDPVAQFSMQESKFYKAWSAGTLSNEALVAYAQEYGAFISLMPKGWEVQGDEETSHEEEEHIELWEKFAEALGTEIGEAKCKAVSTLISETKSLFSNVPTALGSLYAFEVQQPPTAQSKLEGLRKYYPVDQEAEEYFKVHSKNHHEAEKLLSRIERLSAEDQEKALQACEKMSKLLRAALDGLYDDHHSQNCGEACC